MAAEITIRKNGKAEFAFTGSRENIWHRLGQELTPGASIEDWIIESGLNWEIFESMVGFETLEGSKTYDGKRVLFRSDTLEPLSIVGKDYKVVQPVEVLEFFRDLTTLHGMELSAAGSLFGGKKFWATAATNHSFEASLGDEVKGYLLFVTSCDGCIANTVKFSSTRTICNNTLTVALNEKNRKVVKTSHRAQWDPESVKFDMGLVDESWDKFSASIRKLAEVEVTEKFAIDYMQKKFYNPEVLAEDQSPARIKEVSELLGLYSNGMGAGMSHGTAWGIVNAITEKFTHGTGKRDPSHQFMQSYFGRGDKIKNEVLQDMLALAA